MSSNQPTTKLFVVEGPLRPPPPPPPPYTPPTPPPDYNPPRPPLGGMTSGGGSGSGNPTGGGLYCIDATDGWGYPIGRKCF